MGATTLLSGMVREEPLATVALAIATASGLCALLGIGLILFDVVQGRAQLAPVPSTAPTEPDRAGLLATGLVTADATRWVPAAILQLACAGDLAVVDHRARDLSTGVRDPSVLWLECTSDPDAVDLRAAAREPGQRLIRALFGGAPHHGDRVDLLREGEVARRLAELTAQGVAECREFYAVAPSSPGDSRRPGRIATVMAGAGGLIAIIVAMVADDVTAAGTALAVLVLSTVAIAADSGIPDLETEALEQLNPTGKHLRAQAELVRGTIGRVDFVSIAEGERILPWAVLLDVVDPIDRLGVVIEASGSAPSWYRSEEPATRLRFVSCIDDLVARMRTPRDFSTPPGM